MSAPTKEPAAPSGLSTPSRNPSGIDTPSNFDFPEILTPPSVQNADTPPNLESGFVFCFSDRMNSPPLLINRDSLGLRPPPKQKIGDNPSTPRELMEQLEKELNHLCRNLSSPKSAKISAGPVAYPGEAIQMDDRFHPLLDDAMLEGTPSTIRSPSSILSPSSVLRSYASSRKESLKGSPKSPPNTPKVGDGEEELRQQNVYINYAPFDPDFYENLVIEHSFPATPLRRTPSPHNLPPESLLFSPNNNKNEENLVSGLIRNRKTEKNRMISFSEEEEDEEEEEHLDKEEEARKNLIYLLGRKFPQFSISKKNFYFVLLPQILLATFLGIGFYFVRNKYTVNSTV